MEQEIFCACISTDKSLWPKNVDVFITDQYCKGHCANCKGEIWIGPRVKKIPAKKLYMECVAIVALEAKEVTLANLGGGGGSDGKIIDLRRTEL